jgi:hypothetical protein
MHHKLVLGTADHARDTEACQCNPPQNPTNPKPAPSPAETLVNKVNRCLDQLTQLNAEVLGIKKTLNTVDTRLDEVEDRLSKLDGY